ncbi:MAG: hypothetical protein UX65_C0010G0020 [Parcubacteria group bacterium GW2011_GWB1_46_8]|nr:MAG: hypothetical protein UX65_C0010G0020 [Parcubacteria group bacterium GW2011_GWB1_46_8]
MSYHESPIEKQDYKCFVGAFVLVIGSICAMLFGFAWLSTAERISADVFWAAHLEGRITALENRPILIEHIHPETNKGFTGKAIK